MRLESVLQLTFLNGNPNPSILWALFLLYSLPHSYREKTTVPKYGRWQYFYKRNSLKLCTKWRTASAHVKKIILFSHFLSGFWSWTVEGFAFVAKSSSLSLLNWKSNFHEVLLSRLKINEKEQGFEKTALFMIHWAFLALKLFRTIRRRQNFDSQSAFTLDVLFCSNVSTPKPKWAKANWWTASFVYCAPARVTRQNKLFWKVKINRDIKQQFFFLFFVRGNRYVLIPLQSPGSKRWCILRCQARGNEYLMFRCNTWEDLACSRFTAKFHIVYGTQKGDFFSPTCATSV